MKLPEAKDSLVNYRREKDLLGFFINEEADSWSTFYIDVVDYSGNTFDTKDLLERTGLVVTNIMTDDPAVPEDAQMRVWLKPIGIEIGGEVLYE